MSVVQKILTKRASKLNLALGAGLFGGGAGAGYSAGKSDATFSDVAGKHLTAAKDTASDAFSATKDQAGKAWDATKAWAGKPVVEGSSLTRGQAAGAGAATVGAAALLYALLRKRRSPKVASAAGEVPVPATTPATTPAVAPAPAKGITGLQATGIAAGGLTAAGLLYALLRKKSKPAGR